MLFDHYLLWSASPVGFPIASSLFSYLMQIQTLIFTIHPRLWDYLTPFPAWCTSSLGLAKEEASCWCGNILGNSLLEGPRRGHSKSSWMVGNPQAGPLPTGKPAGTKAKDRLSPKALAGTLQAFWVVLVLLPASSGVVPWPSPWIF